MSASDTPRTDDLCEEFNIHALNPVADRFRMMERELTAARAEAEALRKDAERYRWLLDRVLACDYGDNNEPGGKIGWRIRHDLLPKNGGRQPAFMFGESVNAAIDAARSTEGK